MVGTSSSGFWWCLEPEKLLHFSTRNGCDRLASSQKTSVLYLHRCERYTVKYVATFVQPRTAVHDSSVSTTWWQPSVDIVGDREHTWNVNCTLGASKVTDDVMS